MSQVDNMRRSTTLITIITARKPNASIQQSSIILFDTTGTQSNILMNATVEWIGRIGITMFKANGCGAVCYMSSIDDTS